MSESENLPMNFGGIDQEEYSSFDSARVLILPVSYEGTVSYGTGTSAGAMAIVNASRNMALNGGEDFELLFTLTSQPTDAFPGTLIGEITPGPSEVLLVRDGKTEHLSPKGYRHF